MWRSPFSAFITRLTFYGFFPSESSTRSINFYWGLYKHLSELEVFKATYHLDVVLACIILLLFPLRSHTVFKLQLKSLTNNCPALWLRKGKGKDCFGQIWGVIWFCLFVSLFFKVSEPGKKILISLRVKRSQKSFLFHLILSKNTLLFCHSM